MLLFIKADNVLYFPLSEEEMEEIIEQEYGEILFNSTYLEYSAYLACSNYIGDKAIL